MIIKKARMTYPPIWGMDLKSYHNPLIYDIKFKNYLWKWSVNNTVTCLNLLMWWTYTKFSKNSCTLIFYYLNQMKLCLNKSSNCVEYNDLIFIKMDSTLTKLYIFVINYLFFKKKLYFCKLWFKSGEIIPK